MATDNVVLDPNIVRAGDFILHINSQNDDDDDTANFKDATVALGFRQHILFSTNKSGNTLDLIFMEEYSNIKVTPCRKVTISDHCLITCTITLTKPDITCKLVKYRNLKNINAELTCTDIKLDYYEDIPLSDLVHQFDTSLREALDKHAPIQSKSIAKRRHVPLFTPDEKKPKRKCITQKSCEVSHAWHVSDCGRDSKKLYAPVSSLRGTIQSNPLPECVILTLLQRTLQISSTQQSRRSGITWTISQRTGHSIRISKFWIDSIPCSHMKCYRS